MNAEVSNEMNVAQPRLELPTIQSLNSVTESHFTKESDWKDHIDDGKKDAY